MTDRGGIAIFVKTPGLTPAKTRLAAGLGAEAAETFYRLSLAAVRETVERFVRNRAPGWTPLWAVAEPDGVDDPLWRDFGAMHTGDGELGERMARVYEHLLKEHGAAMLIGADAPQMTTDHLAAGAGMLDRHDFAFGPATDGGFYLFAGRNQVPLPVWITTPYSVSETLVVLMSQMAAAGLHDVATLDMLTDVDQLADLEFLTGEMPAKPGNSQKQLIDWLKARAAA